MTLEEAAEVIAPIIWKMCEAHRAADDKQMVAYLEQNIALLCRHMERFCVPYASEAAIAEAESWGVDLYDLTWGQQSRFDEGRKRIHFEHMYTVGMMKRDVLAAKSEQDVQGVLAQAAVAWITKGEDDKLTDKGYRSIRRDGAARAYEAVGITLRKRER